MGRWLTEEGRKALEEQIRKERKALGKSRKIAPRVRIGTLEWIIANDNIPRKIK